MSEQFATTIQGGAGTVHTGSGDVYNIEAPKLADRAGHTPREQAAADLAWLKRCYVHPMGFGEARATLEDHRTVFLEAPAGSGRSAAAKILLQELPGNGRIAEFPLQEDDASSRLDVEHLHKHDRVWLDLSGVEGRTFAGVQDELPTLRTTICQLDAYLVIVLPDKPPDLPGELDRMRVRLRAPDLWKVLERHLRVRKVPLPDSRVWPGPRTFPAFLGKAPPVRDVERFATLVAEAHGRASSGDLAQWFADAEKAVSDRMSEASQLFADRKSAEDRALLITTALLHGSRDDTVHDATAKLLHVFEKARPERTRLEDVPFDQRLKEVHAKRDECHRIRFEALDLDTAVRRYSWRNLPDLRDKLTTWVREVLGDGTVRLENGERDELLERFVREGLEGGQSDLLFRLVTELVPTSDGRAPAARVLQIGLQDPAQARGFRSWIFDRSREEGLSPSFTAVLVAACKDVMVIRHPSMAVVRLHHLARRERGDTARRGLAEIVRADQGNLRLMLERLVLFGPYPKDGLIFLEFAASDALLRPDPGEPRLLAEPALRQRAAACWALAFRTTPPDSWSPIARQWLVAASAPAMRGLLLITLVTGARGGPGVLPHLFALTRSPDVTDAVSEALLRHARPFRPPSRRSA